MNTEEEREDQLCTDMGEEHTSYELINPRYPPSTVEHDEAIEGVGHLFPGGRLNHPPPRNLGEIKIIGTTPGAKKEFTFSKVGSNPSDIFNIRIHDLINCRKIKLATQMYVGYFLNCYL